MTTRHSIVADPHAVVGWTARVEGRPLRLATADQDRPGLRAVFLLDRGGWRHLVRRAPVEMMAEVLGDAGVAAAVVAAHGDTTVRRTSVVG